MFLWREEKKKVTSDGVVQVGQWMSRCSRANITTATHGYVLSVLSLRFSVYRKATAVSLGYEKLITVY